MTEAESIKFVNLADRRDVVPVVAKWYYDEWGTAQPENSYTITLRKVETQLNRDRVYTL